LKILCCDDHELFRDGLRVALAGVSGEAGPLELIEAGSLGEAEARLDADPEIELLLLDLELPDASGIDGLRRVRGARPDLPVVVISAHEDAELARTVLAAGAVGFIPKSSSRPLLQRAIALVRAGGVYVPPLTLERSRADTAASDAPRALAGASGLTEREREVAELLTRGLTNRDIARVLGIAPATVKVHVGRILATLEVSNRTEAVRVLMLGGDEPAR
jgi:DNA-binding NarL/FixJ family response regulator